MGQHKALFLNKAPFRHTPGEGRGRDGRRDQLLRGAAPRPAVREGHDVAGVSRCALFPFAFYRDQIKEGSFLLFLQKGTGDVFIRVPPFYLDRSYFPS